MNWKERALVFLAGCGFLGVFAMANRARMETTIARLTAERDSLKAELGNCKGTLLGNGIPVKVEKGERVFIPLGSYKVVYFEGDPPLTRQIEKRNGVSDTTVWIRENPDTLKAGER